MFSFARMLVNKEYTLEKTYSSFNKMDFAV